MTKKIVIYVFSGTYNTQKIAQLYQKFLEPEYIVKIISIEKNMEIDNLVKYDLIGIGYPIHAFNCPQIVDQFVKKLPNL